MSVPQGFDPDRARLDDWFAEALELDADERAVFVASARRAEPALGAELEELLRFAAAPSPELEPDALAGGPLWQALTAETLPEPLLAPGARVGPWRVERELGRGGMGAVYLAERADGGFEQRAALKLLHPGVQSEELLRRFERERQILASLQHPNIARLLDGGRTVDGRPYFAMEYVEGRPIDRYCDEERLNVDQRLELFLQVGRALQHAHRNLVVHRDLKPSNIAVTGEGEVKLLDFGIARLLTPEALDETLTLTAGRMLTPRYASPEQMLGDPVTTASDVYQMGLLLYELVTGEHAQPVADSAPSSWVRAICEHPPTRPSVAVERAHGAPAAAAVRRTTPSALVRELRGDLDNILLVALRKEPDRRYGSAGELVDDVVRCRRRLPVHARPDTVAYRTVRFVQRHRAVLGVAAVGLLAFAAALVMVVGQRLQAERQAALARQMESTLGQLFAAATPGPEQTVRGFVDQGLRLVRSELAGQPESQARLMTLLGRDYNHLGLYTESAAVLEEALALLAARAKDDDLAAGETIAWLAQAYHYSSRYREALAQTRRVFDLRRRLLGDGHADTVRAQLQLGDILHTVGRLPEAEAELRGALVHLRSAGAEADPLATGLRDLGNVLRDRGEAVDAERCFRESLALFRNDRQQTWRTEIYFSRLLIMEAQLEEAERLLLDALANLRRQHGGDHPTAGEALRELGHLRLAQGNYAEADARLAEAVALFHRFNDDEHAMFARIKALQSELALRRGDPAAAVVTARDALARFERLGLTEHPAALDSRRALGRALLALGEPTQAVAELDTTRRAEERLFVPDDRRSGVTRAALASARRALAAAGGEPRDGAGT